MSPRREVVVKLAPVTDPEFILESARLRLRLYRPEDACDLEKILGDPETMSYYPSPFTRVQVDAWIADQLERYERDGFGLWAITLKLTGEFLGNCGPAVRVVDGHAETELGWHVNRAHWNRGIATEAATVCRDHCFGGLGIDRLISLVRPVNKPSGRVAEKIGMSVEKEVQYANLLHFVYALEPGG